MEQKGSNQEPASVGNAPWASVQCSVCVTNPKPHLPHPRYRAAPAWTTAATGSKTMQPVTCDNNYNNYNHSSTTSAVVASTSSRIYSDTSLKSSSDRIRDNPTNDLRPQQQLSQQLQQLLLQLQLQYY